jgi:hypothetical protein
MGKKSEIARANPLTRRLSVDRLCKDGAIRYPIQQALALILWSEWGAGVCFFLPAVEINLFVGSDTFSLD